MPATPAATTALLLLALLSAAASGAEVKVTGAAASSGQVKVTPVQKVIQLLEGMVAKGVKEMKAEQLQFSVYKQWCENIVGEKIGAIDSAKQQITVYVADIQEYASNIEVLTKEIAALEADIFAWNGDAKAATKVREIEKADFDALYKDYSESIDALQRAILVLQEQAHDRKQSDKTVGKYGEVSLAQVNDLTNLKLIPDDAKRAINMYLKQDPEVLLEVDEPDSGLAVSSPQANAYEFQSQGVIDMLKKLLDKFLDERAALEKAENESVHAFEILMQDLRNKIAAAEEDLAEKEALKAQTKQKKADTEGDLVDTKGTMEADIKFLTETKATCEQKAQDFESRQKLRIDELEAIKKAIEIISSSAVKGNAEKHLPTLAQQSASAALAQLRADGQSPLQKRVAGFLMDRSKRIGSRILSALAIRVAADPFKKVKKMIKDLIIKLMEQANEEATHKGWCDQELSTNAQSRKDKTLAVELLHAEIDELEASVAKIAEELAELTAAVAELDAAMAKATEVRIAEKTKNTETIEDSKEAQVAVSQALAVLKEFYAKAAEATALVQARQPEIFDSPYTGMQGMAGGVVGMLEVIMSDFARLEADTKQAEATAQKEYDEFMTGAKMDKASKERDIAHKSAKKQDQEKAIVSKTADLEGTQKELDAALDYYEKLKPSCVDSGVTFEDEVAARKEEIESLQDALRILNGEDLA